jgi:hypothetical protein
LSEQSCLLSVDTLREVATTKVAPSAKLHPVEVAFLEVAFQWKMGIEVASLLKLKSLEVVSEFNPKSEVAAKFRGQSCNYFLHNIFAM